MEIIIIACLLVIIVLLSYDIFKKAKQKPVVKSRDNNEKKYPNIMGSTRSQNGIQQPTTVKEVPLEHKRLKDDSFVLDNLEEEFEIEISQEELKDLIEIVPDWEEEEEELKRYSVLDNEDGFATGATFEELADLGGLLESKTLEPLEKDIAVSMISRIDGTELLGLLEIQIEDASKKIALLLDREIT